MSRIIAICLMIIMLSSSISFAAVDPNQVISKYAWPTSTPKMAIIVTNLGVAKKYPQILDDINKKIIEPSKSRFALYANQKNTTQFLEYLEDIKIDDPNKLTRNDIAAFGKKYGYEYVAVLNFNQIHERDTMDVFVIPWGSSKHVSAEMVAKIVRIEDGSYIYRKDIVKEGQSSTFLPLVSGHRADAMHAWLNLVTLCVDEFIEDLQWINE